MEIVGGGIFAPSVRSRNSGRSVGLGLSRLLYLKLNSVRGKNSSSTAKHNGYYDSDVLARPDFSQMVPFKPKVIDVGKEILSTVKGAGTNVVLLFSFIFTYVM